MRENWARIWKWPVTVRKPPAVPPSVTPKLRTLKERRQLASVRGMPSRRTSASRKRNVSGPTIPSFVSPYSPWIAAIATTSSSVHTPVGSVPTRSWMRRVRVWSKRCWLKRRALWICSGVRSGCAAGATSGGGVARSRWTSDVAR